MLIVNLIWPDVAETKTTDLINPNKEDHIVNSSIMF